MILMKPIHNRHDEIFWIVLVVIPHKVNDFNETNSQPKQQTPLRKRVVIPHKVNDFNETNSQP